MGIQYNGIAAEKWLLETLRKSFFCLQIDALSKEGDMYVLNEIKGQERFEAGWNGIPPWDGHGLTEQQIKARLQVQNELHVRSRFIVKEPSGEIFWQWLDTFAALEHGTLRIIGESFLTKGSYTKEGVWQPPRRVFPLERYEKGMWFS